MKQHFFGNHGFIQQIQFDLPQPVTTWCDRRKGGRTGNNMGGLKESRLVTCFKSHGKDCLRYIKYVKHHFRRYLRQSDMCFVRIKNQYTYFDTRNSVANTFTCFFIKNAYETLQGCNYQLAVSWDDLWPVSRALQRSWVDAVFGCQIRSTRSFNLCMSDRIANHQRFHFGSFLFCKMGQHSMA